MCPLEPTAHWKASAENESSQHADAEQGKRWFNMFQPTKCCHFEDAHSGLWLINTEPFPRNSLLPPRLARGRSSGGGRVFFCLAGGGLKPSRKLDHFQRSKGSNSQVRDVDAATMRGALQLWLLKPLGHPSSWAFAKDCKIFSRSCVPFWNNLIHWNPRRSFIQFAWCTIYLEKVEACWARWDGDFEHRSSNIKNFWTLMGFLRLSVHAVCCNVAISRNQTLYSTGFPNLPVLVATHGRSRHLDEKSWQKPSNGEIHWAATRAARPHLPATNFTLANDECYLWNHSQVRRKNNLNLIRGIPVQPPKPDYLSMSLPTSSARLSAQRDCGTPWVYSQWGHSLGTRTESMEQALLPTCNTGLVEVLYKLYKKHCNYFRTEHTE